MAAPSKKKKDPIERKPKKEGLQSKKITMKKSLKTSKDVMSSSRTKKSHFEIPAKPENPIIQFEEDSLRGGQNVVSSREEDESRAEAGAEFEAEQSDSKNKRKPGRSNNVDGKMGSRFRHSINGELAKGANQNTLKAHPIDLGLGKIGISELSVLRDGDLATSDLLGEHEATEFPVLAQADSRAFVPCLEVTLDDMEGSDLEAVEATMEKNDKYAEKNRRRKKKMAKEEREQEIRAAEVRLLEQDIPRTADEFEKLARRSPNSSFVWINYMAFMLSMADVEKARSIAERAFQTINFREEGEKLNIWVAYFNLENKYGSPPKEAIMKVFQRALQYCDPKKLHFSLLGVYERTQQDKVAEELLDRMTKKFRCSCKVWLKRVESLLKQGKDGVQSVVNRALLSLPRNKHIKFISRAAILEFKCGVPDRGRSIFEGILREYPKRTDLWSIYLDQEIHLADAEVI